MSALDRVKFNATSTGTGAFVVASAVSGFLTPAGAAIVDTTPVPYTAQNPSDATQWEYGYSVSASSATSFARTVTRSSSGLAALCSFGNAPVVSFGPLSENEPCLSVALFGAVGDNSHDDTVALQAAINYALANTVTIYLNSGAQYKITSALLIHGNVSGFGFGIIGNGAYIRQFTANTAILSFKGLLQFGMVFDNFTLTYNAAQASSNASSFGILFEAGVDTPNTALVFNSRFTNIRITNAFKGMTQGADFTAVWGNRFENFYFDTCSGPAVDLFYADVDQPNNYFGNIYVNAQFMEAGFKTFTMTNMSNLTLDNIEVNSLNGNSLPVYLIESCSGVYCRNIRVEGGSFTGVYQALFAISSCPEFVMTYFEVASIAFNQVASYAYFFTSFGTETWSVDLIGYGSCSGTNYYGVDTGSKGTMFPIRDNGSNTGYQGDVYFDASLGLVRYKPLWSGDYTVATLPTASVTWTGVRLSVNDALTPVIGMPVVAGGAVFVPVVCNGVSWLADSSGPQGTPAAKTTSTQLTAAELLGGILTVNQGAAGASALQLPTATSMDSALPGWLANNYFDFSLINISTVATETASLTTASGWTLVGNMIVPADTVAAPIGSSGRFRARKTATGSPGTYTLYRLS